MEEAIKALVTAMRGANYGNADKAYRGLLFAFRKEWETQEAASKQAAVELVTPVVE